MGATPNQLKTEIDQTRGDLTDNVNALADKVSPARITRRRFRAVKDAATGVKDTVVGGASDKTGSAAATVSDGAGSVRDTVAGAPTTVARRTQGNPLPVALIAFGAGALAASLLPETDAETRVAESMAGNGVDVVGAAKNAAAESGQRLKDSMTPRAQQALTSVKESAGQAVQTTKAQAEDVAGDVASHGERAAEQVRGKAQSAKSKTTATTRKTASGRAGSNGGAKASDVHVVHKNGNWVVEQKGAGVISTHRTQALAEQAGRRVARRDKTEFVLHAANGRIREKDSYGHDPRGRG